MNNIKIAQDFNLKGVVVPADKAVINVNSASLSFGSIISSLLPYIFTIAGILLLVYLIFGGFQLMLSRGDPKAAQSARSHITNALVGFIIIFIAFWVVQLFGAVFGLKDINQIFNPFPNGRQ